ncbi:MAG: hypothetical protein ACREX3_15945 [Gammaproteobacteria bacterium]
MQTTITEIAPDVLRLSTFVSDFDMEVNQFLVRDAAIADAYLAIHRQQRIAWTLELDLRPWVEKF